MTTLKNVRERISSDPTNWQLYLMDFVDEFRRTGDTKMIEEPFDLVGDHHDALLASTTEALCDELKIDAPEWLSRVPACREPYFVAGLENLKAISLVESPTRFRIRKVFVLENFLSRV